MIINMVQDNSTWRSIMIESATACSPPGGGNKRHMRLKSDYKHGTGNATQCKIATDSATAYGSPGGGNKRHMRLMGDYKHGSGQPDMMQDND